MGTTTFEARVLIKSEKPIRWHPWKDGAEYRKTIKMLHIDRRTREQAVKIAQQHGKVLSCRKLNIEAIEFNVENIPIDNAKYVNVNPYPSAVAMDEMIWRKRQLRRKNMQRDKENY